MNTKIAARRKIVVRHGDIRHDVAIAPDLPIGMSLQGIGVDPANPAVIAVDSMGQKIDLSVLPEHGLPDGSVVTFVNLNRPAIATAPLNVTIASRRTARGRIAGWLTAVLTILLAFTVATLFIPNRFGLTSATPSSDGGVTLPQWLRIAVGVFLLIVAVAAAIIDGSRRPQAENVRGAPSTRSFYGGPGIPSLVLAPVVGAVAGIVATPAVFEGQDHLMLFIAFAMGAITATFGYVARRGHSTARGAGIMAAMASVIAAFLGFALWIGWPSEVAVAVLTGLVPPILRALPSWCLDVDDAQLVDIANNTDLRWTVRGALPSTPERLEGNDVFSMVNGGVLQRNVGTIILSVIPVVFLPWIFLRITPGTIQWWGAIALSACVVLSFAYQPRVARDLVSRWAPRISAGLVLVELAVGTVFIYQEHAVALSVITFTLALLAGITIFALVRGYRSLGFSRIADAIEQISVTLALPAGMVAAGLIDILRTMTSG